MTQTVLSARKPRSTSTVFWTGWKERESEGRESASAIRQSVWTMSRLFINQLLHMQQTQPVFFTSDILLASTLNAMGFITIEIERDDPKRCKFVFDDSDELQTVVNGYWNKELRVEVHALFNAMKNLKSRLYNGG